MLIAARALSLARQFLWQLLWLAAFAQLSFTSIAMAEDGPAIFDVRRSLPLEPDEPTYHDFYIDAGPEAGFKKGMYVTVVRSMPIHDPIQNKQQATLNIKVARLQIVHVERNISVARLYNELGNEDRPVLEYESVMIGDRIETASMTMEAPAKKSKAPANPKTARVQEGRREERPTRNEGGTESSPVPPPADQGGPTSASESEDGVILAEENPFPESVFAANVRVLEKLAYERLGLIGSN